MGCDRNLGSNKPSEDYLKKAPCVTALGSIEAQAKSLGNPIPQLLSI